LLLFPEPEFPVDRLGETLSDGFSLDDGDELLAAGMILLLGELSIGLADGDGVVPVFDE
jgi:hypothetical protein